MPVTITRYGEHSLKIVPAHPLRPGEYALSTRSAFLNLVSTSSILLSRWKSHASFEPSHTAWAREAAVPQNMRPQSWFKQL